ncbi:MAG: glycosyltransferase family 4 protein [Ignavibacteria bacterium]|nr:glycosyltransferase family 4 protein [Ignavibacteria bacterium]
MKPKILHITPDFDYACGRSYYVFLLLKYLKKDFNVSLITNGGDSIQRIEEESIKYSIFRGLKSKNPISVARNISGLRTYIKEHKIDIVHTHHRLAEFIALQSISSNGSGEVSSVFTSLSIVNRKFNVEFKSDRIIAVSNSVKNMLTGKFNISESKISLIPNFTDTDEINELEIIAKHTRDHGRFYNILAVGRFHHEKNFETLLKAMKIINNANFSLILVGEGDNDIDYKKYISKHNLNVEIIVPQKNLLQYFLVADLCVLPSVRDPFPNFMLQAGLHKKPFIGANVDGIGELINDGVNGLLFRSGNENELAEKIMKFATDRDFAAHCADNLHKDVLNNFTQEFIIPKIKKLYNSLLK